MNIRITVEDLDAREPLCGERIKDVLHTVRKLAGEPQKPLP